MQVPRDLLEQKLGALTLVLPALLADSLPEHHEAEFDKLAQDLLEQCQTENRDYVLDGLAQLRRQVGLPARNGTGRPA